MRFSVCCFVSAGSAFYYEEVEARAGIEPTNGAFAELCLTGWLPRRKLKSRIVARRCDLSKALGK